jgi:5-(carboxyamino)imidazole ribonucleotide mutase
MNRKSPKIAIIMGSKTDFKVMQEASKCLLEFGIKAHIEIVSAHRTPEKMFDFAKSAANKGFQVIIAGAGGAAHLPGMVACLTTLPVIGVPIAVGKLNGLDALLSIAQMPKGIPVATVAVDNARNAALLATRILANTDSGLQKKMSSFLKTQKLQVKKMNKDIKSEIKKLVRY